MKKKGIITLLIFTCLCLLVTFLLVKSSTNKVDASVPSGYVLDETYDDLSISDLNIDGLVNQSMIEDNSNKDVTFKQNDTDKSLVLKFRYDVQNSSASDSIAFRVHFDVADDKWNENNALWIRGDGIFLKVYSGSEFTYSKKSALTSGVHTIEFGRIALYKNGNPSGKYYVYYKVDGVEKDYSVTQYDKAKMDNTMFFNFSASNKTNKVYDIRDYERPDEISVGDLKSGGYLIGDQLDLNAHTTVSYDSNALHKSTIFRFLYDVKNQSTIDCQIHFSNTWLGDTHGGVIWLRNDKNRISKVNGEYLEASPFASNKTYNVEVGKLYMNFGSNAGKYYIYLKVDGQVQLEYYLNDMPDNASIFFTGTNGDSIYDLNYMPVELSTDIYLYKWNKEKSGILYTAKLKKAFLNLQGVSEVGFIVYPKNDTNQSIKVVGKLTENNNDYIVKAAYTNISDENIAKEYTAKLYYVVGSSSDKQTYYKDTITSSFYNELQDISDLSSADQATLTAIKNKILNISVDEDNCTVVGATKNGDFSSASIVLTGENNSYSSYYLNGNLLSNNQVIQIGYRQYKVTLGTNKVTLTKQTKKIVWGGSEHFVEINSGHDEGMTAQNLAPMTTNLGLTSVRLDISFGSLFTVNQNNELTVRNSYRAAIQGVIDELKANGGVTDFLAVFWVIQPYGYKTWEGKPWAEKVSPNPSTESEMYLKWLKLNGEAARMAAELFPDIQYFETWNEAEMMCEADGPLCKKDGTNYTVTEKAKILTDLMYYYNKGIKEANPKNVLTTPSLCCSQVTDNDFDCPTIDVLKAFYTQIKDQTPVTGYSVVDSNPNNYFQVINIHPYITRGTTYNNWTNFVESFNTVAAQNGDGGTEVWITEFGYAQNRTANFYNEFLNVLDKANNIECLTRFYFYKVHDYTSKIDNDNWGLYNYDGTIKQIGTAVKNKISSFNE